MFLKSLSKSRSVFLVPNLINICAIYVYGMCTCACSGQFYLLLQIENKRLELLDHTLVSEWIQQKWQRAQIIYYVVLAVYCIFLAMLTAFATVSPRPADSIACTLCFP